MPVHVTQGLHSPPMARPFPVTLWILASLAPLAVRAAPARGADPPAASSAATADPAISDLVGRGDKARRAGRWREAAEAYADALAAAERAGLPEKERAVLVGELGAAEVALRKYREGAEHLHRSLVHEQGFSAEQQDRHSRAREKAAAEVGTLIVAVSPPDAEVSLNTTTIQERGSGHVFFVEPGEHTIRARRKGYADAMVTQDMVKGSKVRVALRLERLPQKQAVVAAPCVEPAGKPAPRPSAPCPAPAKDWVPTFRTGAFITAGVGAAVGAGLLIATVPVHEAILERVDTFGKREGNRACKNPSPANAEECSAQADLLSARAALMGTGWTMLGVSGMIATVAASSYFWHVSKGDAAPVRITAITTGGYTGAAVVGVW